MILAACSTVSLASCSSDDNEGGNTVPSSTLTDANGNKLRVTSFGREASFHYDETGKLISFTDNDLTFELKENAFVIDNPEKTYKLSINKQGLISGVYICVNFDDSYAHYKENYTYDLKYNSNRQLVSISGFGEEVEYDQEGNIAYSESVKGTITNTWNNGNLTKSVMSATYTGIEDGMKYSEKESSTIEFVYSNQINTFKQFPVLIAQEISEDMTYFAVPGLVGVGPVNLPTSSVYKYYEDGYNETEESSYTFILNDNGSIHSEQINPYSPDVYNYEIGTRTITILNVDSSSPLSTLLKNGNIFKHKKRRE